MTDEADGGHTGNDTAPAPFQLHDPYDYPGWPIEKRLVAVSADIDPATIADSDGSYQQVCGLLADYDFRGYVALADAMGLVGDWGIDDVLDAVTEALHEYRDLKTRRSSDFTGGSDSGN